MRTTTPPRRSTHTKKRSACPTGKVRFRDHRQAVERLHHAQNARRSAQQDGAQTTHAAVRTYACPQCRGHHLTSWAADFSGSVPA